MFCAPVLVSAYFVHLCFFVNKVLYFIGNNLKIGYFMDPRYG